MVNMIFAGTNFTLGRVMYVVVMLIGIHIAVVYEEKRLEIMCPNYKEYKLKVKNKFIPDFTPLIFKKKEKIKTN
jgi:hypothetical protein